MPPHNNSFDESDCQAIMSVGQIFNSLLSSYDNVCSSGSYSPTEADELRETTTPSINRETIPTSPPKIQRNRQQPVLVAATSFIQAQDPRRPPSYPKPKPTCSRHHRRRKKPGLSISLPTYKSDDVHTIPPPCRENAPPLISCSRNIELRRKSLGEQHFFRPVSEDYEDGDSRSDMMEAIETIV